MCFNKYYCLLKKKLITLKPITHTMLPTPLSQKKKKINNNNNTNSPPEVPNG